LQKKELDYAQLKIQVLEEQLRLERVTRFGPGSEKLSNLQLELLEAEPTLSRDEVTADHESNLWQCGTPADRRCSIFA
jgi:transposase